MNKTTSAVHSWQFATIGELFDIKDAERVPVNAKERAIRLGNVPYYGATGQVGWIDDYLFDQELILLGEDGAPFFQADRPKAYLVRGKSWVNNHAHVLRALGGTPGGFWKYQLDQVDFHGFVSGTTRLKLPQASMRRIPLAVPPLQEQHRIVDAIESYFTRLDDATATLERVQRNLKRYRASVLKAAVEGRLVPTEAELARAEGRDYEHASVLLKRTLTDRRRSWEKAELARLTANGRPPKNPDWKSKYTSPIEPDTNSLPELPEGWCWATIDQLCSKVTDGEHITPRTASAGVPLLSAKHVRENGVIMDDAKFVTADDAKAFRRRCDPENDDILMVSRGATIGRTTVVQTRTKFCLMGSVILLKVERTIVPHFVQLMLVTGMTKQQLTALSGSTAQQAIYIRDIRSLPVALAPLSEQMRIAEQAVRYQSIFDQNAAELTRSSKRLHHLRQSVLKWAFEGRLVDQDPSDEPASALLERIKAERAAATTKSNRKPRRKGNSANT